MVIGMANNLDEVWISVDPFLPMLYTNQYLPNLYRWYVLLNITSLVFVMIVKQILKILNVVMIKHY